MGGWEQLHRDELSPQKGRYNTLMKIGLISDTHIPDYHSEPPAQVAQAFHGVDLILHAGDIYNPSCLDWLERIAPVIACEGNGDFHRRIQDPRIQPTRLLHLDGLTVGLTHGILSPDGLPVATLNTAMKREFGQSVDVIVYGDRILFYYTGTNSRSPEVALELGDKSTEGIGLAISRLDGFVSLDSGNGWVVTDTPEDELQNISMGDYPRQISQGPESFSQVVTRPFSFSGSQLQINASMAPIAAGSASAQASWPLPCSADGVGDEKLGDVAVE